MRYILAFVMFSVLISSFAVVGATSGSPDIAATLINQDPDPVEQGDVVEIRFKIENDGRETFDNVEIELIENFPFSIYSGGSKKQIGRLPSSQRSVNDVIIDFKLKVDENAADGDNEVEVRILVGGKEYASYTDNEFLIDIKDLDIPEIQTYLRDSEILKVGDSGSITIEIANVDLGDAKFLQLRLMPSENYELLSSSNYIYIGDVDSDDTESEDFEIYLKNSDNGVVLIPIMIEYQDTNEHKYERGFDIELRVYDENELSKFGLREKSNTFVILLVIVVLVVAYFLWKRRKKKK